jgi:hypothetical protein
MKKNSNMGGKLKHNNLLKQKVAADLCSLATILVNYKFPLIQH